MLPYSLSVLLFPTLPHLRGFSVWLMRLGRVRVRTRLGWMDGVKVVLGNRGMTVEAAQKTGMRGGP